MNKKRYLVIVGIVVAAVVISVLLHTMLGNQPPRIVSLGAWPENVLPLESCRITCHAVDPDEDELSYSWSATAGEITGEGGTVNWTAPDSGGSYKVTVSVTDPRGGEAVSQTTIAVGSAGDPADRVDVVYFHRTQRCHRCLYAENMTRHTLETYFADELASGKVTFQSVNVEEQENADIVKKYNNASYLTLGINTVRDGTDNIEVVTDIWYVIDNDQGFVNIVKDKVQQSLTGEA